MGKKNEQPNPTPSEPENRCSVRIGLIEIEYEGDDPQEFARKCAAALMGLLAPIRQAMNR